MKLFKVTHPWNCTGNTVLMVYDTCLVMKIFTIGLPAECDWRAESGIKYPNVGVILSLLAPE